MKIIAVANGKGGVGKTTTTAHVGVNLFQRGYYAAFLDTDPLLSLTDWWDLRTSPDPELISCHLHKLDEAIAQLEAAGVEYLLIDTPGFMSGQVNDLLKRADLIVMMSKASPLDLRATIRSLDFIEAQGVEQPMVFVLNEVRKGTKIENESILALSQFGKLAPVVHYKDAFVSSMINGHVLEEIAKNDNPGIAQIDALTEYVLAQLGVKKPKPIVREEPSAQGSAEVIDLASKRGAAGKGKSPAKKKA